MLDLSGRIKQPPGGDIDIQYSSITFNGANGRQLTVPGPAQVGRFVLGR